MIDLGNKNTWVYDKKEGSGKHVKMVRVNGVQHEVVVNGESMALGKESEEYNPDVPAYVREVLNNAGVETWVNYSDAPV